MTDLKNREAFEDWFSCNAIRDHEYVRGERMDENGNYYSEYAYLAWSAWQAAKAQAVPKWISVEEQLPPNDPYNREYWVYETLNNKVQHDYWACPDNELEQPFFNNWFGSVTHWRPMVKYPNPPVQVQEPTND